jgi:PST family polysaccharide transporter
MAALWLTAGYRVAMILADAPLAAFAAAYVLESLLGSLGAVWILRRARGSLPWDWDGTLARRFLREGLPLLLSGFAIMVYMRIDVLMIQSISGSAETGVYAAATKLSELWYFVPTALVGSASPALYEAFRNSRAQFLARYQRLMDLSLALGGVCALGLSLASRPLVQWLYGSDYAQAAGMLAVHAWGGLFVCIGLVQSVWWNAHRMNGFYMVCTLAAAVANVGLNLLWIPTHGGLGAAWATVASYACAVSGMPLLWGPARDAMRHQGWALLLPFRLPALLAALRSGSGDRS